MSDAPASTLSKAQVRKIVDKTIEIDSASGEVRTLVFDLLGVSSTRDLVVGIFTQAKGDSNVLSDVETIAKSDPMDAVVDALEMGPDRLKAIWKALSGMQIVSGAMNKSDAKAAGAIARAIHGIDPFRKAELTTAARLLDVN